MNWNDLSISDKAELIKIYVANGILDLNSIKDHYNNNGGKLTFKQWKAQMQSKYPDIEMDNNKAGYDYETYFNNHYDDAIKQLSNLQHFPDTYKLPNHPTFSNESIYSRGPVIGGTWNSDDTFTPSVINEQYYPDRYNRAGNYTEQRIYNRFPHQYPDGGFKDRAKKAAQNIINKQVSNQLRNQVLGINTDSRLNPNSAILKTDTDDRSYTRRDFDNLVQGIIDNSIYQASSPARIDFNTVYDGIAKGTEILPLGLGMIRAPLETTTSIFLGQGADKLVKNTTDYDSWGKFVTGNSKYDVLNTLAEFTNPGYYLGPKVAYNGKNFVRNIQPKHYKDISDIVYKNMSDRAGRISFDTDNKSHASGVYANNFYDKSAIDNFTWTRTSYDRKVKPSLFSLKQPFKSRATNDGANIKVRFNEYFTEPKEFDSLLGHEFQHSIQKLLNEDNKLSVFDKTTGHYVPNPKNKAYNTLKYLLGKNRESWTQSPNEVDSEIIYWKIKNSIPLNKDVNDLNIKDFNSLSDFISKRFMIDNEKTNAILNQLSTMGYF